MASTICRRCRRPLKNPIAIQRGMGEVCFAKSGGQTSIMPEDPDVIMIPFSGNVVCRREGGKKYMNIPQTIIQHSPTGLEWGYGGSGPADFALNVLFFFSKNKSFSEQHHQDFKREFIATLPEAGGEINGEVIKAWISQRLNTKDNFWPMNYKQGDNQPVA